jgi:hypothetical protein
MTIASLSNFTVPLASDQSATTQGNLMPKLKFRFRISFENFGVSNATTELTKQVSEASKPHANFPQQKIEVYNSTINYAGKPVWEPITVKLRDDVTNAVTILDGQQMQRQFDFFEQSLAANAGDYKFTMRIEQLDGGNGTNAPTSLETWELYGCYIEKVNYGDLKYSEQTPMMIELTIRHDNAMQTVPTNALGAPTSVQTFPSTNNSALGS